MKKPSTGQPSDRPLTSTGRPGKLETRTPPFGKPATQRRERERGKERETEREREREAEKQRD